MNHPITQAEDHPKFPRTANPFAQCAWRIGWETFHKRREMPLGLPEFKGIFAAFMEGYHADCGLVLNVDLDAVPGDSQAERATWIVDQATTLKVSAVKLIGPVGPDLALANAVDESLDALGIDVIYAY